MPDYIPIHHVMHVEYGNKALLLLFQSRAVQYEVGQPSNPLTVAWLSGHPPTNTVGDKWTEHVSSDQACHPQVQVLVHLSFLPSFRE